MDIQALADLMREGHLAGIALDAFPDPPTKNNCSFKHPFDGIKNVILTPMIGTASLFGGTACFLVP